MFSTCRPRDSPASLSQFCFCPLLRHFMLPSCSIMFHLFFQADEKLDFSFLAKPCRAPPLLPPAPAPRRLGLRGGRPTVSHARCDLRGEAKLPKNLQATGKHPFQIVGITRCNPCCLYVIQEHKQLYEYKALDSSVDPAKEMANECKRQRAFVTQKKRSWVSTFGRVSEGSFCQSLVELPSSDLLIHNPREHIVSPVKHTIVIIQPQRCPRKKEQQPLIRSSCALSRQEVRTACI